MAVKTAESRRYQLRTAASFRLLLLFCLAVFSCTPSTAQQLAKLVNAIKKANQNPGKKVQVGFCNSMYYPLRKLIPLKKPLPAIKKGAKISLYSSCKDKTGMFPTIIGGNWSFPLFRADPGARYGPCELRFANVWFVQTAVVFNDLPCKITVVNGNIQDSHGPAVKNPRGVGSYTFVQSNFYNCYNKKGHGGALSFGKPGGSSGNILIQRCRFFGNRAGLSGGAIYAAGQGNLTITDSDFTKNIARWKGGAVSLNGPSLKAVRTAFRKNHVKAGPGGGIFTASAIKSPALILCGNKLSNNTARGSKGTGNLGLANTGAGVVQSCRTNLKKGAYVPKTWSVTASCSKCPQGSAT